MIPFGTAYRGVRHAVMLALLFILSACGALTGGGDLEQPTVLTPVAVDTGAMISMLNDYRQKNGRVALALDPRLNDVSQDMAHHIAKRDSMETQAHSAFGLSQRLDKARYANYAGAENLGAGYASLTAAFDGWKGSAGHNKNLLNPYVTRVGIARVNRSNGKWRNFWVMTLSRPKEDGRPVVD